MSAFGKHAIWLLTILLCSVPIAAKKPRGSSDRAELIRLENVWNEAHIRGDAPALNRLWADDLIVTVPGMPVMDKGESLAFARSGRMKFHTYKTSDLRVRVYGNSAVVTGQLERTRSSNSKEFEDDWRFTKVYLRRAGRWQVVAWHGSPVATVSHNVGLRSITLALPNRQSHGVQIPGLITSPHVGDVVRSCSPGGGV